MKPRTRNDGIEVLRCGLMFGICLLHAVTQGGHCRAWAANLLTWCVPAFVFISGWFGIRFKGAKVLKLYGVGLYCAVVFCLFDSVCRGAFDGCPFVRRVWSITVGQWFLNAYVLLMCFAPLLNEACAKVVEMWAEDRRSALAIIAPLLFCAFGWAFALTLPIVPRYLPQSAGVTAYSALTLMGVYVVARIGRGLYDAGRLPRANSVRLIFIALASLILASIGFGDYNSPFSLVISAIAFYAAFHLPVPKAIGRLGALLGPSMFSVYLLHSHGYGWCYLQHLEDYCLENLHFPLFFAYCTVALVVFGVCVLADLLRRLCVMRYRKSNGS